LILNDLFKRISKNPTALQNKIWGCINTVIKNKEYSIKLKLNEVELIRRMLEGYSEFHKCIYLDGPNVSINIHGHRDPEDPINLDELIDKIFKQYYDGDGKLR